MGKPGGFFKRLKGKQKKEGGKRKRGSSGLKKSDRIAKNNDMNDFYRAARQVDELDAVSQSSEEAAPPSDDETTALDTLRGMLGVTAESAPIGGSSDEEADPFEDEEEDFPSDAEEGSGEEEGEEKAAVDEEEEEEEEVACDVCAADLSGGGEGFACVTCKKTFCVACFNKKHAKKHSHQVVSLTELDNEEEDEEAEEAEEEEEEEEDGGANGGGGDTVSDDGVVGFGKDAPEGDELAGGEQDRSMFLPAFDYATPSAEKLKGVVNTADAWWEKFYADNYGKADTSSPEALEPSQRVSQHWSATATRHAKRRLVKMSAAMKTKWDVRPQSIHSTVWKSWKAYRTGLGQPVFTSEEWSYFTALSTYADVFDATRTWDRHQSIVDINALHVINHVYKARAVVLAHDQMLRQQAKRGEETEEEYRDMGFTRTRVALVLPMRNAALQFINTMMNILGLEAEEQRNYKPFSRDFSELEELVDKSFKRRPTEYRKLFDGNINDSFCFGINLSGGKLNVYSHILNSDVLICSPLGLRKCVARNANAVASLSSIEVCIMDQVHVLMMQNWQHVQATLGLLNQKPTDTTEGLADLGRVFAWLLEGKAKRHRQTVMVSEVNNALLLSTFRSFVNNGGRITLSAKAIDGVLPQVMFPIRQHFVRVPAEGVDTVDDDRFQYFTDKVFPTRLQQMIRTKVRTIIFVPSYFDYVKLRNFLDEKDRESFAELCEYTPIKDQRRALGEFTSRERTVLLMTERFYFFKRYFVKLAESLIFYAPPVFPSFYTHLISKLDHTSPNASVLTFFTQPYDAHELCRIVGQAKLKQMYSRDAEAFTFVST